MSQDISSPLAGDTKAGRETQPFPRALDLSALNELAKVYAADYASPHHITFTVEGLRNLFDMIDQTVPQSTQSERMRLIDGLLRVYRHALLSSPIDTERAQAAYSALLEFARFGAQTTPATANQSGEDRAAFVSPRKSEDE